MASLGHSLAFGNRERTDEYVQQIIALPARFSPHYLLHAKQIKSGYTMVLMFGTEQDTFPPIDLYVQGNHLLSCCMIALDQSQYSSLQIAEIALKLKREQNIIPTVFHHDIFKKEAVIKTLHADNTQGRSTFTHYMIGVPLVKPAINVTSELHKNIFNLIGLHNLDKSYDKAINERARAGYPLNDFSQNKYASQEEYRTLQKAHEQKVKAENLNDIKESRSLLGTIIDMNIIKDDGRMRLDKDDPLNRTEQRKFLEFSLNEGLITKEHLTLNEINALKLNV